MFPGYYHGDHYRYVQAHLCELQDAAEEARRARLARGPRALRRRLGHVLLQAGALLLGTPAGPLAASDRQGRAARGAQRTPRPTPQPQPAGTPPALVPPTSTAARPVAGPAARTTGDLAALRPASAEWLGTVRCAEVVRAYVDLRPCPVGYVGTCPWPAHHADRMRPARLWVYSAIDRWRCEATGESGTAFDFICRMEHLSCEAALALCRARWPGRACRTGGRDDA